MYKGGEKKLLLILFSFFFFVAAACNACFCTSIDELHFKLCATPHKMYSTLWFWGLPVDFPNAMFEFSVFWIYVTIDYTRTLIP